MKQPHMRLGMHIILLVSVMSLGLRWTDQALGTQRSPAPVAIAAEADLEGMTKNNTLSEQAVGPFLMRAGVVVDPAAARLYMMNPEGGIDAIQIDTGKLLWTTQSAGKPLTVFDDRLVAEATGSSRTLPIRLLDINHGGRVDSTFALPVIKGVAPAIDNGLGSSSSVDARLLQDGLLIWWTVTSQEVSGVPRPLKVQTDSGAALIDLKTHRVTTLTEEQATARLRSTAPPSAIPKTNGETLYFAPQRADGFFVSVKSGPAAANQTAVLKRWSAESGDPLPDVDLGPGYTGSSISADGSHFTVISVSTSSSPEGPTYLWLIYSIASGQQVSRVRLPDAARPFFISHMVLIYESTPRNRRVNGNWIQDPVGLRGVDLKTGIETWKRALRDTSYHGPYPPHV